MSGTQHLACIERERVLSEYERRRRELDPDRYAPWQSSELLVRSERKRVAARMLHRAGVFPRHSTRCLEVGYGTLGWLGELISWGVSEKRLHGIEINLARARRAREVLPIADLRVGDATELPWDNEHFQLVVASTVFTSILEPRIRQMIAGEITRVLTPGGALLWYDFAVNNPRNPQVRKVSRRELQSLFPELRGTIRWLTLAAPLARWISNKSWVLATFASALPVLQTHLMAVFVKEDS